jgi:hypothetical protein
MEQARAVPPAKRAGELGREAHGPLLHNYSVRRLVSGIAKVASISALRPAAASPNKAN